MSNWHMAEQKWNNMTKAEQLTFEASLPYSLQQWARYNKPFYMQPTSIRDQFVASL